MTDWGGGAARSGAEEAEGRTNTEDGQKMGSTTFSLPALRGLIVPPPLAPFTISQTAVLCGGMGCQGPITEACITCSHEEYASAISG